MRRTKVLPAVLAIVSVFLTAQVSSSEPAKVECKIKPGSSTPPGSHWYYRINRTDKRHCWFLGSVELHARRGDQAQAPAATPAPAEGSTAISPTPAVLSPQPVQTTDEIDFSGRWPESLPRVEDANIVEPPPVSNSYADPEPVKDPAAQPPSRWPVLETTESRHTSVGAMALDYISLAGLMATACLLFVGWTAKFARRTRQRRHDDRRRHGPAADHARSLSPRADRLARRGSQETAVESGARVRGLSRPVEAMAHPRENVAEHLRRQHAGRRVVPRAMIAAE